MKSSKCVRVATAFAVASLAVLWSLRTRDRLSAYGGVELSKGVWYFPQLVSPEVIKAVLASLPPESEWPECLDSTGGRQCSRLAVGSNPHFRKIVSTLGALWGVDAAIKTVEHLPLMRFAPGHAGVPIHTDVHKSAADKDASPEHFEPEPADLTLLLYLTANSPAHGGQTVFVHRNVSVSPSPGALLAWTNTDDRGQIDRRSAHYVTAYSAEAPGMRYVMQFGLQLRPHDGKCPARSAAWERNPDFHPLRGGAGDADRILCGEHLGYSSFFPILGASAPEPDTSGGRCSECPCSRSRVLSAWGKSELRKLLFGASEAASNEVGCEGCCNAD